MKLFFSNLLITLLIVCESQDFPLGFNGYYLYKVQEVISGDLVILRPLNSTTETITVRLAQIDAPHLNQSYGMEAKQYLMRWLDMGNEYLRIGLLVKKRKDRKGRLQGRIFVKRRDINLQMIINGFAWCRRGNQCPYRYKTAMKSAKTKKIGLWKDKKPIPPWRWDQRRNIKRESDQTPKRRSIPVTLNRVVDGDTVYVTRRDSSDKTIIKVRMTGIDSPEMKQSFGPEAKNHLETIFYNLSNKSLVLVIEGTDKYKRTLGVIKNGSLDVNQKMVEEGYAWCYRHTQCPKTYLVAMKNAQKKRKGLFVQHKPTTPWDWRANQKT